MIHTATAQPISDSALTLEQGLFCLDWVEKEQSFNNRFALGDKGYLHIADGIQADVSYASIHLHLKILNP